MSRNVLSITTTDQDRPIRVIQVSDCHLFESCDTKLLGMNTEESFQSVIELIKKENFDKKLSLFIATGDIAQTPSEKTYARFLDQMQTFEEPCVWLQGNHDLNDLFLAQQNHAANMDVITLGSQWLVIMLNSSDDHEITGRLTAEELLWLAKQLSHYPDRHIIIAMHHNPIPIQSKWLDQIGLSNAADFWTVVDQAPQVKAVIHGHIHQNFEFTRGSVKVWACPSTCIQFKPLCDTFALDNLPPGYRWFDLYANGQINTGISRLASMPAGVDFNSSGY
ncbi:MAG: 3',5'-cyclic-AMP phosphodiesterase [Gammaproteobacteria bacterium]|nr:3',5'-cyclic-AMP phosphodiesterase [Gammaproteobacteria bacterium]